VRFTPPLLVALAVITLVACGGNEKTSAPVPLAQRFLTADDAPGSKPDPLEKRQTTVDFDEFIMALSDFAIDPNKKR
jgi:hypothetical protein